MLALLKDVGVFLGFFLLFSLVLIAVFRFAMGFWVYRHSAFRAKRYLKSFAGERTLWDCQIAIHRDLLRRQFCVILFAIFALIPVLAEENGWFKAGAILGILSFLSITLWAESHFSIRIGKLVEIDEECRVLLFKGEDGISDRNFAYVYRDEESGFLFSGEEYMVVDYVTFRMLLKMNPLDVDWGGNSR